MDQFEAMRVYLRVAELKSFTQAANSLGQPKATVSATVQRLEQSLGTRLLHRTTRRVEMTQDGQVYYERCRDLLADVDELNGLFSGDTTELTGRLRVDMSTGVAKFTVLPRLHEFLARHPKLELELSSTDRRVDLVREGFDCVVRVGTLNDSSLIARPLGHYVQYNCASRAYLDRYGVPQTLADLANHRLVHYVSNFGSRSAGFEYVDEEGGAQSLPMAGALTVNNAEAYVAACLAGLGIVQIPAPAAGDELHHWGRLVEILPQYRAAPMPVSIIYPNRRQLPRRVQAFMAWLAEVITPRLTPSDG